MFGYVGIVARVRTAQRKRACTYQKVQRSAMATGIEALHDTLTSILAGKEARQLQARLANSGDRNDSVQAQSVWRRSPTTTYATPCGALEPFVLQLAAMPAMYSTIIHHLTDGFDPFFIHICTVGARFFSIPRDRWMQDWDSGMTLLVLLRLQACSSV